MKLLKMFWLILMMLFIFISVHATTIAVQDFNTEGIEPHIGRVSAREFRNILVANEELTVLDRSSMEMILKEQNFQTSGCTSTECAVEMGKLLAANIIITGTVSKVGKTFYLSVKGISIETGEIKYSESSYDKGEVDIVITIAHNLAAMISNKHYGTSLQLKKVKTTTTIEEKAATPKEGPEKIEALKSFWGKKYFYRGKRLFKWLHYDLVMKAHPECLKGIKKAKTLKGVSTACIVPSAISLVALYLRKLELDRLPEGGELTGMYKFIDDNSIVFLLTLGLGIATSIFSGSFSSSALEKAVERFNDHVDFGAVRISSPRLLFGFRQVSLCVEFR
ncbi:hypothetical protein KAI78_03590 [bacterium]|nr:hypothetical protein [bacterium]